MHSSTFNSSDSASACRASRAIGIVRAALVAYFAVLEVVTAVGMHRVSRGAKRQHDDYARAVALPRNTADGADNVLIVGNSLLLAGVDQPKLISDMAPRYAISFLPIENTTYFDWYFGLRRLFAEGARPSTVVLCLTPQQLVSSSVNGESFARHMMQLRDIGRVASEARLDSTGTSAFLFANFSAWLGDHASIRNWILEMWLPHANLLASRFANGNRGTPPKPGPESGERERMVVQRLDDLRKITDEYGARLIFLIPPILSQEPDLDRFRKEATRHGITVLAPFRPGTAAADHFADDFHLNHVGAMVFTVRLGP